MKYYEILFTLSPCTQDAQDILSALAGEAGCESFEETTTGLTAYCQQQLFDQSALDAALREFPLEHINIIYKVREAEDRDWNEQWEQEGFEPIVIRGEWPEAGGESHARRLVIHDGRHLPQDFSPATSRSPLTSDGAPLTAIEIDARQAFGTGTHETTRMICAVLTGMDISGMSVLDCGCGTGILGICALKLGAARCVAYDIDEWSTDNTRHNAVINRVDDRLTVLHGDSTVTDGLGAEFGLVMANINRNILLHDMGRLRRLMAAGATLILSGFYKNDCASLESKAQQLGLTLTATHSDGDWACMVFRA